MKLIPNTEYDIHFQQKKNEYKSQNYMDMGK